MKNYTLFFFICFLLLVQLNAQTTTHLKITNTTSLSVNDRPFWLGANRDGKIQPENRFINLTDIYFFGIHYNPDSSSFFIGGTDVLAVFGDKSKYYQINELFAGINMNNWEVNAGLWVNEMQLGGLSTSNGNLASSRNARPYPRINVRLADFKPLPLIGQYVLFKGEFEEGWLIDNRYVKNTHLHHKSFYLKFKFSGNFDFQGGIEHYVMWGGISQNENIGELPNNFHAYIKYITGQSGSNEFLEPDQKNVAGNQYGTYQAKLSYQLPKWNLVFNLSHPFEDLSGVNWRNWKDNLISIHISSTDRERLFTDFLYEFTNTRNQSARTDSAFYWHEGSQSYRKEEYDNYYNHSVYQSGTTYQQLAISSPLFFPVTINNGISYGFRSTRLFAHHIGAKGKLNSAITWKGLLTYIHHLGSYNNGYSYPGQQVSGLLQLTYAGNRLPFNISVELASDKIDDEEDRFGAQFSIYKKW
ncbi:MAG: hypothetical protein JXR61_12715 [Prolixibacteraceae bacterium]|nr:hypothetical protein [Prolixibacteraceae bacterium]